MVTHELYGILSFQWHSIKLWKQNWKILQGGKHIKVYDWLALGLLLSIERNSALNCGIWDPYRKNENTLNCNIDSTFNCETY